MTGLTLVGRGEEISRLTGHLDASVSGSGVTVLVSGEAGIGKTRLLEEFTTLAGAGGVKVLRGSAERDRADPYLPFSEALGGELDGPLFPEMTYTNFTELFAVNKSGLLIAQASPEEGGLDADIFAGMLSAVQDFVRDSFDSTGEQKAGLGRLEYGDLKILIEHGGEIFLTAVIRSSEHKEMKVELKRAVRGIEEEHGETLASWSGRMEDVGSIVDEITNLANRRFLVRRGTEGADLDKERLKVSDLVLRHLTSPATGQPVLLLLEDLHWADESSLFVLHYLARNIKTERIMILATSRPEEGHGLAQALADLRGESFAELELKRLGEADVVDLVNRLCEPNAFPAEFLDNLSGQCAGNPFFVIEMLVHMQNEGLIGQENGTYFLASEDYSVPGSVEELVNRRLETLEPDTMAMAEYASCIGQDFDRGVVLSIGSLRDPAGALERLRATNIIVADNGHVGFSHAIFRDVVYAGIGGRWKSAYHKEIGEYYETAYADNPDEVMYELARHFSKGGEPLKARDYGLKAGEKAESAFAAEQAIAFYDLALAAVPGTRDSSTDVEVEILEHLGDVLTLTGEWATANERYAAAIEKATGSRTKADLHRRIADNLIKLGDSEAGDLECQKALGLLGGDESAESARLLMVQGWSFNKIGEFDRADDLFRQGMRIAEKLGMEREIAQGHHSLGTMEWYRGNFDVSLEHFRKAIDIRERLGDTVGLAGSIQNAGAVYHMKGELEKALDNKERAHGLYVKVGDKAGIASSLNNIGIVFYDQGDFDTCLDYYEESAAIKEQIGDLHGLSTTLNNIGIVYSEMGEVDRALEYYDRALELNRRINSKHGIIYNQCSLADVLFERGETESAMAAADEALSLSVEIGAKGEEAWARRNVAKGLWKSGEWAEAEAELDLVLKTFEDIGELEEVPKTYFEFGNYWKEKGDAGKAKEAYLKALEGFEEMGQKLNIDKTREVIERLEAGK